MSSKLDLQEVLESKAYVKNGITYQTPKQYLQPALDMMSKYTDKFVVKASEKAINANEDSTINLAWGRVLIETDFSGDDMEGLYKNVGIVYSVDNIKPVVKVYTGTIVSACTNLCIFQAEHVLTHPLAEGMDRPYEFIHDYLDNMERTLDEYRKIKNNMINLKYYAKDVYEKLGELLHYSYKNKYLGKTAVVNASDLLFDNSSKYYFEGETNAWNMYNAVTQYITDKVDIFDKPGKTALLSKFFLKN